MRWVAVDTSDGVVIAIDYFGDLQIFQSVDYLQPAREDRQRRSRNRHPAQSTVRGRARRAHAKAPVWILKRASLVRPRRPQDPEPLPGRSTIG